MTRRVSKKQHNVTSYSEERSLPQVNECAFDSGLIEKNDANTNLDIAGWILSGGKFTFLAYRGTECSKQGAVR